MLPIIFIKQLILKILQILVFKVFILVLEQCKQITFRFLIFKWL